MTEQHAGNPTAGPGTSKPGPAEAFMNELQTMTGANVAGKAPMGTPRPEGAGASAAGMGGGGTSPAPPPTPSGPQANDQVTQLLEKISSRLDAQGQFLTKLDSKIAQTRQEFESRYKAPPRSSGDDDVDDANPPQFNINTMAQQITQAVVNQVRNDFAPLVQQTAANSVAQRVQQALYNPEINRMVNELPPEVKAGLAQHVYKVAGDSIFKEPNPLMDEPDPVHDAIELIHYRTVVKTGRQNTQAAGSQANAGPQSTSPHGFSPVPNTGTHSQGPVKSEQEALTENLFGIDLGTGRRRYPKAIEEEFGL